MTDFGICYAHTITDEGQIWRARLSQWYTLPRQITAEPVYTVKLSTSWSEKPPTPFAEGQGIPEWTKCQISNLSIYADGNPGRKTANLTKFYISETSAPTFLYWKLRLVRESRYFWYVCNVVLVFFTIFNLSLWGGLFGAGSILAVLFSTHSRFLHFLFYRMPEQKVNRLVQDEA